MPGTDASVLPNNNATFCINALRCLRSPMLANSLKMAYEDRLNMSRKLFNLSRKRVENLKRNKNNKRSSRKIEKPGDNEWITSGPLGSKDAVLVFRTSILNEQKRSTSNDLGCNYKTGTSKETTENNTAVSTITNKTDVEKCDTIKQLPSSSTPLSPANANNISVKSPDAKYGEEIDLIPMLKSNIKGKIKGDDKMQKSNQLVCIIKSRKHLIDSISLSDNSISSEDDDEDDDDDNSDEIENTNATAENENVSELTEMKVQNSNELPEDMQDDSENHNRMGMQDCDDYTPVEGMPAIDLKITYKFHQTETMLLRKIFVRHGLTEAENDDNFNILWTGVHMKPDILRNLTPYQRVNHFPRSYELTRKDRLYKNIERMQHLRGVRHFDIVPQSFILPLEYKNLVSAHNKSRGPWIVKPAASSRGRGIFIVNSPDQIPQEEQVLVSKYISDPLCIDGHKCDLRVYVLVTSFDPLIIYMYEEGIVRLATVKYNLNADNLWNPCMHLCNYSINKYHTDYIKSSDAHEEDVGHKWTLSALLRHLKSQGCDTRLLMSNIEDLIIKAIFSCTQSIISACRMFVPNGNNCFELYGFDILIDYTLKPWLLEVNLSPSMGVDSPLDAKVKASMITDLLTCVGIPACTKGMRVHYDSKWTRFRNVTFKRRTNSAEPLSGGSNSGTHQPVKRSNNANPHTRSTLTLEEQRIVRNARLQNARRGGFVRIFPTEDTYVKYAHFLDPSTGIPLSTSVVQGLCFQSPIVQHNYNQMLYNSLYGNQWKEGSFREDNTFEERMDQYERAIETSSPITFRRKRVEPKCEEEGKRLRKQILKLIDNGSEFTQLQARQTFSLYLECILRRLTQEPKDCHEKIILKFLNRIGGAIKAPVFFRSAHNSHVVSKARSAMVAKLLCDFLEQYNRDTEAYIDTFDHFAMIPSNLFNDFLSQAQESDLEAVLALHTNVTGSMPYLYNRCGLSVPPTPPIPSGVHGFLKAMPAMVQTGSASRDFNKTDSYYRCLEKDKESSLSSRSMDSSYSNNSSSSNINKIVGRKYGSIDKR